MRQTITVVGALILFLAFALPGCAEDPTSVGAGVLPIGDLPVYSIDTLDASSMNAQRATVLTTRSDGTVFNWVPTTLFLGNVQSLRSGVFVKFHQIPDSLEGGTVTGADLLLYTRSFVGDSSATVAFTIHRGLTSWTGDSLTYDSLEVVDRYFSSSATPPGVGAGSTDSGAVVIPLDTAMVTAWLVSTIDTGNVNQGVYLNPSSATVIRGYYSFLGSSVFQPHLRVRYLKDGVSRTYVHGTGVSRYIASLPPADLPQNSVQAGVAYRSIQTYNISALSRLASVNDARLELTLDSAASLLTGFGADSLYAFLVQDNGSISLASRALSTPSYINSRRSYSLALNSIVQTWLHQVQATLAIAAFSENSSMDRFVFFGPADSIGLRPRLIVTYSEARLVAPNGGGQ